MSKLTKAFIALAFIASQAIVVTPANALPNLTTKQTYRRSQTSKKRYYILVVVKELQSRLKLLKVCLSMFIRALCLELLAQMALVNPL